MGDYSVICALTGIPITCGQKVVGINLEPYKYNSVDTNLFVPAGWPEFGEYDYGGSIEGSKLDRTSCALFHLEVWNNAHLYWHELNNKNKLAISAPEIFEKANKEKELAIYLKSREIDWTYLDYIYHAFNFDQQYNNITDKWLVLRKLFDGTNVSTAGATKGYCFLERNKFADEICQRIQSNTLDLDILDKIVCLWSGQMLTGKHIRPSIDPYIEQYPDYKQRIKCKNFELKLMRGLQKELNK